MKSTAKTKPRRKILSRGESLVKLCRTFAREKKAEDIIILNVTGISSVTDYLLICSGRSEPHLKAIADEITNKLRNQGIKPQGRDGNSASRWIVLVYTDVIVHIFHPELRQLYCLEQLWGDAKKVR